MRFNVIGASAESGDDIDIMLDAVDQADVERIAHEKGILVSAIRVAADNEDRSVELILEEDDPLPTNGHGTQAGVAVAPPAPPAHPAVAHERHGVITLNANTPSDTVHTSEGHVPASQKQEQAMEYHIMMNQALYLLETAVNKYLRDGWEPQGGLCIGMSNNAMQYFQALVRKKKPSV